MAKRDSFVMYETVIEAAKLLPNDNSFRRFIEMVAAYALDEVMPENDGSVEYGYFILCYKPIDKARKRYEASVENGKKGGRPKKSAAFRLTVEAEE